MGKMFNPKVSIIIPVYNGAKFVREAIESALNQTYRNIEIIVVNDGSNDNGETSKICASYKNDIRFFCKENGGVASALNFGIKEMKGEYFSWLSHDDIYHENKVESQVELLKLRGDKYSIVASGYKVINESGNLLFEVNPTEKNGIEQLEKPLFALLNGYINGCTLLIHKSHFDRVGLFKEELWSTQDYDFFFRAMRGNEILYQNEMYVYSRAHADQGSKKRINSHIDECNKLWLNILNQLSSDEKRKIYKTDFLFYWNLNEFFRKNTKYDKVIKHLDNAIVGEAINCIKFDNQENVNREVLLPILDKIGIDSGFLENENNISLMKHEKSKPRIAFLVGEGDEKGGLNHVVFQVAKGISEKFDVYLIFFDKPSDKRYFEQGIHSVILEFVGDYKTNLLKVLKLLQTDILVVSHNCISYNLDYYHMASYFDIRTIAWNHEFYFYPYQIKELFECISTRNEKMAYADVVLWLNSLSGNVYSVFNSNGMTMPNPIKLCQRKSVRRKTRSIVAVGRFDDENKGLTELIKGFSIIVDKIPDVTLTVVGTYDLGKIAVRHNTQITYADLIKNLNIPNGSLRFEGWCEDIGKYYEKASINILPSYYEGFGMVVIEAANYGVPSIVFEGSGLEDIVTDGVNGYIVERGNIIDMANKVISFFKNPNELIACADAAREMSYRFDFDKVIKKWTDLIDVILLKDSEVLSDYLKNQQSRRAIDGKQVFLHYEESIHKIIDAYNKQVSFLEDEKCELIYKMQSLNGELDSIKNSLGWKVINMLYNIRKKVKHFIF